MATLGIPQNTIAILQKYNFMFQKRFGQNFLIDTRVLDKIISASGITKDDMILEVGPGIGTMTQYLCESARKVIAVEIDKNLIPILENDTLKEYDNVRVINEDILKLDVNQVIEEEGAQNVKIMGNLPYYITTPIIMKILEDGVKADSITIMMQKEVADRIKAHPGSKTYGALSVAVQYYCTVDKVASVPRSVFVPQPNVDSIVLRLNIRKEKPVELENEKLFFDCVKAGFGQRRKTLLNSLQNVKGVTKEIVVDSLEAAGVESSRRAETLDLEEFARVANEVNKRL